jgi:hypothetical protein
VNRISDNKRAQVLKLLLVDAASLRSTAQVADLSVNTVKKLVIETGASCANFHDEIIKILKLRNLNVSEIYTLDYTNPISGLDGIWTWTAIDPHTGFIASWHVGPRYEDSTEKFLNHVTNSLASDAIDFYTDHGILYKERMATASGESSANSVRIVNSRLDYFLCAVALHYVHHNFVCAWKKSNTTPGMNVGLLDRQLSILEIAKHKKGNALTDSLQDKSRWSQAH